MTDNVPLELLQEVAECAIAHTNPGRYHSVQIPLGLWDEIRNAIGVCRKCGIALDEHEHGICEECDA